MTTFNSLQVAAASSQVPLVRISHEVHLHAYRVRSKGQECLLNSGDQFIRSGLQMAGKQLRVLNDAFRLWLFGMEIVRFSLFKHDMERM
jgi:hypothetical protein